MRSLPSIALMAGVFLFAGATPEARAQYLPPTGYPEGGPPGESPPDGGLPPAPKERKDATCPSVSILADGDHLTAFDGTGRDITAVTYKASLSNAAVACRHRSASRVDVTVQVMLGAELGLAGQKRAIEVPYFVAIIDPEQMVVTKTEGKASITIPKGKRSVDQSLEPPTIKLALEPDTIGADLEVIIGLQLTKDQLEYNRAGH